MKTEIPRSRTRDFSVAVHSCYACDYLGKARVVDDHIHCPECDAWTLNGTWITYNCQDCGFEGSAFVPPTTSPIPCKDCGVAN